MSAFLPAAEHPKAGLLKNMDKGVLADDGDDPLARRSKTPNGGATRKMEAHRWVVTRVNLILMQIEAQEEVQELSVTSMQCMVAVADVVPTACCWLWQCIYARWSSSFLGYCK